MKKCLTTSKSRRTDGELWGVDVVCFFVTLWFMSVAVSIADSCIHDVLKPTRGVSPQRYPENFHLSQRSETRHTKYTTSKPGSTQTPSARYTKVSYHQIRYRYHRHKVTPKVRQKRFVAPVSTAQPPLANTTLPSNATSQTPVVEKDTEIQSSNRNGNATWSRGTQQTNSKNFTVMRTNSTTVKTSSINISKLFKPIRIKLYFDDEHIDYVNTSDEYKRLNESLHLAVLKIEQILSVIPVQGPLLFQRTAEKICRGFWSGQSGRLAESDKRCGIENTRYDGEKCLDDFKIPDDHLAGYAIYKNKDDPHPTTILYENGTGVTDADTVIYIRAKQANMCNDKGVIAYATYCQLDQYNRPVAGFANFCPQHLSEELFNGDSLYLTAIHEFFHALGFSKDLFDKFQECYPQRVERSRERHTGNSEERTKETEVEWVCEDRGKIISFLENTKHIVTPAVARETRKHLNCSSKQGCPLEDHVVLPLKTSSHWEGRFMQGSIMSPMIGLPHLTVIDKITLGAFEDMGWYQVNYSQAEDLAWGKNAGCDFATKADCSRPSSPYFCNLRSIRQGCHFLHLDKGTCETNKYLDTCRMYRPTVGSECWRHRNETKLTEWKGEIYSRESRCFLSNLASEKSKYVPINAEYLIEGRCYVHRCNDSETLEVMVEGSEWRLCPEGAEITFDGYEGHLKCPSAAVICGYEFETTTTPAVAPTSAYPRSDPYCASIKITFPRIGVLHAQIMNKDRDPETAADARRKIDLFLKKFVNEIVAVTDINSTRIVDVHFVTSSTVEFILMKNLDWSTLSPKNPGNSLDPGNYSPSERENERGYRIRYNFKEVSCEEAVRRLLTSVTRGDFKVPVNGEVYRANNITFQSPDKQTELLHEILVPPKKPPSTGTMAAAAVGAVCGMMLITVGIVLYWKSQVTTAVSPAPPSPTATDVRYHPNNGTTVAPSENGSFGQLTFTA